MDDPASVDDAVSHEIIKDAASLEIVNLLLFSGNLFFAKREPRNFSMSFTKRVILFYTLLVLLRGTGK